MPAAGNSSMDLISPWQPACQPPGAPNTPGAPMSLPCPPPAARSATCPPSSDPRPLAAGSAAASLQARAATGKVTQQSSMRWSPNAMQCDVPPQDGPHTGICMNTLPARHLPTAALTDVKACSGPLELRGQAEGKALLRVVQAVLQGVQALQSTVIRNQIAFDHCLEEIAAAPAARACSGTSNSSAGCRQQRLQPPPAPSCSEQRTQRTVMTV